MGERLRIEDCKFNDRGYAGFSCVVVWNQAQIAQNKPLMAVMLEVEDGPHKGKTAYWNGYLTPKAEKITMKTLREALGYEGTMAGLVGMDQKFVGKQVRASFKKDAYNGTERLKCSGLFAPGEGGKPADPQDWRRMFDATPRQELPRHDNARTVEAQSDEDETVDDLPF